jgi:membrane protein DedA with SNARE-associated domain
MYNYLFAIALLSLGASFGTVMGFVLGEHYKSKLITGYQLELRNAEAQIANLEWMLRNQGTKPAK